MNSLRSAPVRSRALLNFLFAIGCGPASTNSLGHDAAVRDGAVGRVDAGRPAMDSGEQLDGSHDTPREGGIGHSDDAENTHSHDPAMDAARVPEDAGELQADAAAPCSTLVRNDSAEPWVHVAVGSVVTYANDPPTSGSHYPVWARWQTHASPVPRPYWVHNLEHGGVVLLYGPGATSDQISDLKAVYGSLPADPKCAHARTLLTADPDLDAPIAAVAARHVMLAKCVDAARIIEFVNTYRDMAPESVCGDGSYP